MCLRTTRPARATDQAQPRLLLPLLQLLLRQQLMLLQLHALRRLTLPAPHILRCSLTRMYLSALPSLHRRMMVCRLMHLLALWLPLT